MTITATYKDDGKEKYQSHEYHIKIQDYKATTNINISIDSYGEDKKECVDEMIKEIESIKSQMNFIHARLLKDQEAINFTIDN